MASGAQIESAAKGNNLDLRAVLQNFEQRLAALELAIAQIKAALNIK